MFNDFHAYSLMLAQDGPPPPPGERGALVPGGGTGANGAPGVPGDAAAPRGGFDLVMIMMLAILAIIVFSIMGQRRERKKREAMIGAIKKHDKVQTIGGVIGSIVELKPDFVVLKVDESSNTRITFARSAIQQIIKSSPGKAEAEVESE